MQRLTRSNRRRELTPQVTALVAALIGTRVLPEQLQPCDPVLVMPEWGKR